MTDTLTNVVCALFIGLVYKHLYAIVAVILSAWRQL